MVDSTHVNVIWQIVTSDTAKGIAIVVAIIGGIISVLWNIFQWGARLGERRELESKLADANRLAGEFKSKSESYEQEIRGLKEKILLVKKEANEREQGLKEEYENKERELEKEITRLKQTGISLGDWTPNSISTKSWHNCDPLYPLVCNIEKPYVISFNVSALKDDEWRAGVIFFKENKRHDPSLIFHLHSHSRLIKNANYTIWCYWKYPLIKSSVYLNDPDLTEPLTHWNGAMRLVFREDSLILSIDNLAWRLSKDDINLNEIGVPHLAQWCDTGIAHLSFKNIIASPESPREAALMDELCWSTRFLGVKRIRLPQEFEDEFKFLQKDFWSVPPVKWNPEIHKIGVELIPHNEEDGQKSKEKALSNVLLLEKITSFVNGEIYCNVFLAPGAIFDVLFRGSLSEDEFYMARFDTRQTYRDCILFKPRGKPWSVCQEGLGNEISLANKWLDMRIVANGPTISLYRNGNLVHQITDAKEVPGRIGLFAEEEKVFVRKFKVLAT